MALNHLLFQYIHAFMQLLDSDWPAYILAGLHFRAQEIRALSPDGVCALVRGHETNSQCDKSGLFVVYVVVVLQLDKG